jgi:hypothetical protein
VAQSGISTYRYVGEQIFLLLLFTGSLMCYLELQNKSREALVSGYAVWPDVFARIFLGTYPGQQDLDNVVWLGLCTYDVQFKSSWRKHKHVNCLVIAGYLCYDTTNMLIYYKYLGDKSAIIHHVIFACAAAYVLGHSIMAFPFVWLALCEISTPSLNLRCV